MGSLLLYYQVFQFSNSAERTLQFGITKFRPVPFLQVYTGTRCTSGTAANIFLSVRIIATHNPYFRLSKSPLSQVRTFRWPRSPATGRETGGGLDVIWLLPELFQFLFLTTNFAVQRLLFPGLRRHAKAYHMAMKHKLQVACLQHISLFKNIVFRRVLLKYVRFPRGLVAKKGEEGILTPVV